jgi:hypothetical protein
LWISILTATNDEKKCHPVQFEWREVVLKTDQRRGKIRKNEAYRHENAKRADAAKRVPNVSET